MGREKAMLVSAGINTPSSLLFRIPASEAAKLHLDYHALPGEKSNDGNGIRRPHGAGGDDSAPEPR